MIFTFSIKKPLIFGLIWFEISWNTEIKTKKLIKLKLFFISIMKISSKLKETLKEFCSGCTAHGLANIAKTDSYLFLFIWIIALLSAIAASVYCNIILIALFFSNI